MRIEVVNYDYACSTLIMGGFYHHHFSSVQEVLDAIRDEAFNANDRMDDSVSDHAFIMVSTSSKMDNRELIIQALKKLGFKATSENYNAKNGTVVTLYYIEADAFWENINEV